jgi:hypothetical protein
VEEGRRVIMQDEEDAREIGKAEEKQGEYKRLIHTAKSTLMRNLLSAGQYTYLV